MSESEIMIIEQQQQKMAELGAELEQVKAAAAESRRVMSAFVEAVFENATGKLAPSLEVTDDWRRVLTNADQATLELMEACGLAQSHVEYNWFRLLPLPQPPVLGAKDGGEGE